MLVWPATLATLCPNITTDMNFGQGYYHVFHTANVSACCDACVSALGFCRAWDFATDSHGCWLKDNSNGGRSEGKRMSGKVEPPPRNESTAFWHDKRTAVLRTVWDDGSVPLSRSQPDAIEPTNVTGLTKLSWQTSSRLLNLTSFGFHHVISTRARSRTAVVMAHGHFYANWNYTSNCFRETPGCPATPTCNLSCAFWDLNNISTWLHQDLEQA